MLVEDYLNADYIRGALDELNEVLTDIENLDCAIVCWRKDGVIHHRAYGDDVELLGLMDKVHYIMLRENTGETSHKDLET